MNGRTGAVGVETLGVPFAAVVRGVALAEADDATIDQLADAWMEYPLLVFPGQHLSRAEQDRFAQRFGELEFTATALTNIRSDGSLRSVDDDLSKSLRANEQWHHDSTFMPVQAKGAVFTAEIVPDEGGETGFADMRAAYEALDDSTKDRIAALSAYHSRRYGMDRVGLTISEGNGRALYGYELDTPPPLRPLVKIHPVTGRPNLLIGAHAHAIPGLSAADSEALIDRLNAESCAPSQTYYHHWTAGDAVLWDNRRLMHRATPHDPDQPRRMWHTRIAGDPATESG